MVPAVALAATQHPPATNGHFMTAVQPTGPVASGSAIDLTYGGGAVLHSPKVYLTFWGWNTPVSDPDGAEAYLKAFFQGVGGSGWANIQTQYYGPSHVSISNPTVQYGGAWHDDSLVPPPVDAGSFAAYAGNEAAKAVQHFGYNADGFYLVLTPHGADGDFAGAYCAYHAAATDNLGRQYAWSIVPYVSDFPTVPDPTAAGTAIAGCGVDFIPNSPHGRLDAFSMTAGHEFEEAVTDKAPPSGWYASDGENADKCQFVWGGAGGYREITLSTGTFGVQGLWSNAAHGCVTTYP